MCGCHQQGMVEDLMCEKAIVITYQLHGEDHMVHGDVQTVCSECSVA